MQLLLFNSSVSSPLRHRGNTFPHRFRLNYVVETVLIMVWFIRNFGFLMPMCFLAASFDFFLIVFGVYYFYTSSRQLPSESAWDVWRLYFFFYYYYLFFCLTNWCMRWFGSNGIVNEIILKKCIFCKLKIIKPKIKKM